MKQALQTCRLKTNLRSEYKYEKDKRTRSILRH